MLHASKRQPLTSLCALVLTRYLSVYLSEIFPTWMRAQGVSFSVAGLFATNLVYTGSASAAFASIGWKYYLGITYYISIARNIADREVQSSSSFR